MKCERWRYRGAKVKGIREQETKREREKVKKKSQSGKVGK